jgi:hypothetical protein
MRLAFSKVFFSFERNQTFLKFWKLYSNHKEPRMLWFIGEFLIGASERFIEDYLNENRNLCLPVLNGLNLQTT